MRCSLAGSPCSFAACLVMQSAGKRRKKVGCAAGPAGTPPLRRPWRAELFFRCLCLQETPMAAPEAQKLPDGSKWVQGTLCKCFF